MGKPKKGLLARVLSRLRGKPKAPKRTLGGMGHRGIAIGSTKPGEGDLSQANIDKWKVTTDEDTQSFIYDSIPFFVHSTNVESAQYFYDDRKMLIKFLGGSGAYLYSNVSPEEALQFAQAQSKGAWCWDKLRIRGTKNGHRKPYVKL